MIVDAHWPCTTDSTWIFDDFCVISCDPQLCYASETAPFNRSRRGTAREKHGSCSHGCCGPTPDSVQHAVLRASTLDPDLHRDHCHRADSGHPGVVAYVPAFSKYETTWWTRRWFMGSWCNLLAPLQFLFVTGTFMKSLWPDGVRVVLCFPCLCCALLVA